MIIKYSIATILSSVVLVCNAYAKECFEEVVKVPAGTMVCDQDKSNSADFTVGCHLSTVDVTEQVPVACPEARWMPMPAHWAGDIYTNRPPTRTDICEFYKMENADINGRTCASPMNHPTDGIGANTINPWIHHGGSEPPFVAGSASSRSPTEYFPYGVLSSSIHTSKQYIRPDGAKYWNGYISEGGRYTQTWQGAEYCSTWPWPTVISNYVGWPTAKYCK